MIKRLKTKRSLIAFVALGLVLLLGANRLGLGPFKHQAVKVREEIPVAEEKIISASGKVEAKNVANLTFQISGLLAWVGVKEGDSVQKWQGIATLDKKELEKRLRRYLNLYMTNRWDFEQLQDDYKDEKERHLITDAIQRILDKAQFSLNNAVIDVEIADLALRLATISTPIEGIVTRVDPSNAGVNVTPATAAFTIVDPSSVYFVANVDETDIGKIKAGQKAKITLDSYSDEKFEGKVEKVAFVATSTAGGGTAFRVEISLPKNENFLFRVGMNGDAEIMLE